MHVSHGISLRKKRSVKPKISAPKQIGASQAQDRPTLPQLGDARHPSPSPANSSTSLNVTRSRDRGTSPSAGGNTADYVKRRYSTRIPQGQLNLADAPTLPSLPSDFLTQPPARAPGRSASGYSNEKVAVDLQALQDPNLPAEQYVAHLLANATEQDIRDYQADLSKIKNRTSTDLQHSVYQNRSQFIKISQEAERLKGEMRALRNLMADLTGTLGQTNAALGINTETVGARKYANRSSVANLEAMWSTHLQELWRRVEGSQKYLPAIPGRHVVHESGRWVELNNATFKPRHRVHIILLNDHLLVAVEKKRTDLASPNPDASARPKGLSAAAASQTPLVADRCMPLQDIEITDLSAKAAATALSSSSKRRDAARQQPSSSAILIRLGQDSYTYAATDAEGTEKPSLLSKVRRSTADLRKRLHTDLDADSALAATSPSAYRPSGMIFTPNSHHIQKPSTTNTLNTAPRRSTILLTLDSHPHPLTHIDDLLSTLSHSIALHRFPPAITTLQTLRRISAQNRSNAHVTSLVDPAIATHSARLAAVLTKQMCATSAFKERTREYVSWLKELGFEGPASSAFLEKRSEVVSARLGLCRDSGDLVGYLGEVAYITFALVRNTVAVYQAAFGAAMGSCVVSWAVKVVEGFNETCKRQLGIGSEMGREGREEGRLVLERARECALVLKEVGIDFRGLVGRGVGEVV